MSARRDERRVKSERGRCVLVILYKAMILGREEIALLVIYITIHESNMDFLNTNYLYATYIYLFA